MTTLYLLSPRFKELCQSSPACSARMPECTTVCGSDRDRISSPWIPLRRSADPGSVNQPLTLAARWRQRDARLQVTYKTTRTVVAHSGCRAYAISACAVDRNPLRPVMAWKILRLSRARRRPGLHASGGFFRLPRPCSSKSSRPVQNHLLTFLFRQDPPAGEDK